MWDEGMQQGVGEAGGKSMGEKKEIYVLICVIL